MCTDLRYSLFIYIYGFRFERNFKHALTFDDLCRKVTPFCTWNIKINQVLLKVFEVM